MVSQLLSNLLRPPFRSARHSSATLNPWSRNHAGRCKCHSPPPHQHTYLSTSFGAASAPGQTKVSRIVSSGTPCARRRCVAKALLPMPLKGLPLPLPCLPLLLPRKAHSGSGSVGVQPQQAVRAAVTLALIATGPRWRLLTPLSSL
jgi:hypothetical protein